MEPIKLHETLVKELKWLRQDEGLTEERLSKQRTVWNHLTGETTAAKLETLVGFVDAVSNDDQRIALTYAYGLMGPKSRYAGPRREIAKTDLLTSASTLNRWEIAACGDVARRMIEHSPNLSETERQDEIDYLSSTAKRLSDLETIVYYLVRKSVAGPELGDNRIERLVAAVNDDRDAWELAVFELADRLDADRTDGVFKSIFTDPRIESSRSPEPESQPDEEAPKNWREKVLHQLRRIRRGY